MRNKFFGTIEANMKTESEIYNLVKKQLSSFFNITKEDSTHIKKNLPAAHQRANFCFKHINNKYYSAFKTTHSGQYSAFLYYIANEISLKVGANETSEKLYYLNKIMHSLDLYYEVKLPEIFYWEHPLGTVLGRAQYSNFFTIYQGCTVGGSFDSKGAIKYPKFAENVTLFSNSSVLGNCKIGKNSIIASHTYLLNQEVPENSIVFGQGKDIIIKKNTKKISFFKPL